MSKEFVWALNVDGKPTKCYASEENRGKGKCNHLFHQKEDESLNHFLSRAYKNNNNNSNDNNNNKNNNKSSSQVKSCKKIDTELLHSEIKNELEKIDRPGMDNLIKYLEESDFYRAPSSTKFHLCEEGGLAQHSSNVHKILKSMLKDNGDGTYTYELIPGKKIADFSEESLIIASLLHDFCKINKYKPIYKTRTNKEGEEYVYRSSYKWEDNDVIGGHGMASVYKIEKFIKLTDEEKAAIRWHMGLFDCKDQFETMTFDKTCKKYPLVLLLHTADNAASKFVEGKSGNLS